MRHLRFILLISVFLLITATCYAALDADTIFEFRSTATANMVNGGGFNSTNATPGTDYSTYDAAEDSGTDLTCTDGDAAAPVIASLTHNFVDADEGNIIHITETGTGFTTGWYEIVSTSLNTATLDRACGANGALTGGDWYLGGALNVGGSLEDDFFEAISTATAADGITVYFYNNNSTTSVTFTPSEAIDISGSGGATNPIKIIGYKTTREDKPTGTSRPTIALGANVLTFTGSNFEVSNLILTGTGTSVITFTGGSSKIINCKVINPSTTADRQGLNSSVGGGDLILNNESINYRGRGCIVQDSAIVAYNYFHDSDIGLRWLADNGGTVLGNLITANVTAAISNGTALTTNVNSIIGNTLYGSEAKTGTGLVIVTGVTKMRLLNNIIAGFITGVSGADASTSGYDDYNDYYNNTNDVNAAANWQKGSNDQALDPQFTSVAQVTGTTATYAGTTLTDAAANFNNVVDNQDFVLIVSGTGLTTANVQYLITSHTATTITTSQDAGESGASNWIYQVTTGRNFAIGTNLKALGFPGAFQAGLSTGYLDIGAVQRQEAGSSVTVGYSSE